MSELYIFDKSNYKVQPFWIRSIRFIINNYEKNLDQCPSVEEKIKKLKLLWEEEFSAFLLKDDNGKFFKIVFKNENEKMLFLLKFFR